MWVEGVRGAWEVCPVFLCWLHCYATRLKGSSGQRGTCNKIDSAERVATGVSVRTEGRQPRTRKEQDMH